MDSNERVVVHVREEAHDKLAVHAVCKRVSRCNHAWLRKAKQTRDTTMSGDGVSKVLNLEGTLESRSEESTKGSDETGKGSHGEDVELHGRKDEALAQERPQELGNKEFPGDKDWVGVALEASEGICTQVLDGADEVLVTHEDVGHERTNYHCANPSTHEALDRLLWRNFDERRPAESDTANVRENVVCDDQGNWEEEPDHSLKDVVDDEVRLNNDKVQRHVGPCELCELELVVALL